MDAGTLNCPDCGAGVPANATECSFCHARLATIGCEKCFGMVFVGSRHCQHCGAPVKSPEGRIAEALQCPRGCGEMRGVRFGGADMWECRKCSGLWVDTETLERLIAERLKPAAMLGTGITVVPPAPVRLQPVKYAPCPKCRTLMNRLNFAHTSGIIVDVCRAHGTWFDADELRRVVEFVGRGGLEAAHAHEREEVRLASGRPTPLDQITIKKVVKPLLTRDGFSLTFSILTSYVQSRPRR